MTATLKSDATILDLVKQLHPTPALGGEPRDKALQFIDEKEPFDRGWYAGPIGWLMQISTENSPSRFVRDSLLKIKLRYSQVVVS